MATITNPSGVQDIDGILWGWQWTPNQANGHTQLLYSFPTSPAAYGYFVWGFEAFNSAQEAAAERAIANYDAVCNADFVYTADGAAGNIRFAEADQFMFSNFFGTFTWTSPSPPAYGLAPDNVLVPLAAQGDTWFSHQGYNSPGLGSFAYSFGILHEIGHALGLKHGQDSQDVFDANANVVRTNPALPAAHDSVEYSVMTYRPYPGAPFLEVPDEGPSTLMQDDIYALQWMYGANYDYNAGNTTYTWNSMTGEMAVDGTPQGIPFNHKILMTVWDGGGNDTYDFSNFATPVWADLHPGAWSTPDRSKLVDLDWHEDAVHLARGCIANALAWQGDGDGHRSYIENARGGSGNDVLIGNEIANALFGNRGADALIGDAGNDRLVGGRGPDALSGGAGRDVFDFNFVNETGRTARTHDLVIDFQHRADRIDLSTIDANGQARGNAAFKFGAQESTHFTGVKGELHWHQVNARGTSHDQTIIEGDINGDRHADFEIALTGLHHLSKGDFIL